MLKNVAVRDIDRLVRENDFIDRSIKGLYWGISLGIVLFLTLVSFSQYLIATATLISCLMVWALIEAFEKTDGRSGGRVTISTVFTVSAFIAAVDLSITSIALGTSAPAWFLMATCVLSMKGTFGLIRKLFPWILGGTAAFINIVVLGMAWSVPGTTPQSMSQDLMLAIFQVCLVIFLGLATASLQEQTEVAYVNAEQAKEVIEAQARELDTNNHRLEEQVRERTRELELKNLQLSGALDAAQEATRLKGRFLSNMSHELRTPLNGVIGMLDVLEDMGLDEEQLEVLETAKHSADLLLKLSSNLLDAMGIESGVFRLDETIFRFREVCVDVADEFEHAARAKGLAFRRDLDVSVGDLYGDAHATRAVLSSILENAVKFTSVGEVAFGIARKTNDTYEVVVQDTGPGFDVESFRFEMFSAHDISSTKENCGVGIGLATAYKLVQLMGGDLVLERVDATGGTRVTIVIPGARDAGVPDFEFSLDGIFDSDEPRFYVCAPEDESAIDHYELLLRNADRYVTRSMADAEAIVHVGADLARDYGKPTLAVVTVDSPTLAATVTLRRGHTPAEFRKALALFMHFVPGREASSSRGSQRMSALIVEDNAINQKVLVAVLKAFGFECESVENGAEAVAIAGRKYFDLVLMDCQMPVMDGYEATRALRERGFTRPVIAVTANAGVGDEEKCLAAGMDAYLTKPVKKESLGRVIHDVFSKAYGG